MKHFLHLLRTCTLPLLAFVVPTVVCGQASTANYTFSTNATGSLALDMNSNAVDMSTGATSLLVAGTDDTRSSSSNIGFGFVFMGVPYTTFSCTDNGIVQLGGATVGNSTYLISSNTTLPLLAPFSNDLRVGTDGAVRSKVLGTAPNRTLVIEYANMMIRYATAAAGTGTFQVRLYETTGVIEYVYGAMATNAATPGNVNIGFGTNTTANTFVTVNSSHVANTSGTFATVTYTASSTVTHLHSTADGSRRVYRFTPSVTPDTPVAAATPIDNIGLTAMRINWQDAANELGYLVYRSTDDINYTLASTLAANTTTFNATGLLPGTTYYWQVYSVAEGRGSSALGSSGGYTATTLSGSLSGTKTVCPSGCDYPTLTAAFADAALVQLNGALTLALNPTYVSTSETFPITVSNSISTSSTLSITVRPNTGATALSITGANTTALIDLNNARHITFDGRPIGTTDETVRELTIDNTNTSGAAVRLINGAQNNTLRSLILRGQSTSTTSGVVLFSTANASGEGNSQNTIRYSNINGVANAANGIYAAGTTTSASASNDANTIAYNNIFDFFRAAATSAGINIAGGNAVNSAWTIEHNSIYQTASRTYTAALDVFGININPGSNPAGTYTISNNKIGGSAADAGGTAWTGTGNANRFAGIMVSAAGTTTATLISQNVINNLNLTSTSTTAGYVTLIRADRGNFTIQNNILGQASGTGITLAGSASGNIFGIRANTSTTGTGSVTYLINGNFVGGINVTNTGAASFRAISQENSVTTYAANVSIQNNRINNISSATNTTFFGIISTASGTVSISGNTISNLTHTSTGTSASLRAIDVAAGTNTISQNIIRNLTSSSTNNSSGNLASVCGIAYSFSGLGQIISRNTISALSNSHTGTSAVNVVGIHYQNATADAGVISRNFIHSLAAYANSLTSTVTGIMTGSTSTGLFQNNMIRLGIDSLGADLTAAVQYRGMFKNSSAVQQYYHNTVYIGGAGVGTNVSNTAAFWQNTSATGDDVRNNIFVNVRSNAAAGGAHYAVNYTSATGLTSNANLYQSGGTGGVLGRVGSTDCATLVSLRTSTAGDVLSVSGNPQLVAPVAAVPDLHIHPSNPTPVEASGVSLAAVTDDYDGEVRSALSPVDIGADAGNFTPQDIAAPIITYTALGNTALLTNRTLSVTITDVSGVDVTTAKPRIYFKKSTDADAFVGNTSADNGWKFAEAINTVSPFNFVINYAILNGGSVTSGDIIQYFVVAQDVAVPTVGWFPSLSFTTVPVSTNLTGSFPLISGTPSSYSITPSFAGTYNVGTGETYTSLTGAGGLFAAINAATLTGNVIANITSDLTEDGATALNQWPEDGVGGYTLTIQPSAASMRTITSSFVGGVIRLNGADRVTIDGRFGGSGNFLTINHTAATGTRAAVQLISLGTGAGATNTTIRNVTFTQALGGTASYGVSAGGSTIGTAGADHDNLVIQDNTFTNANFSIYAEGTAAGLLDGLVISGNTLNSTVTAGTLAGIRVVQATSPTISANTISLETNQGNTPVGISLETGVTGAVVSRNLITKVLTTNSGGYGGRGITVATGSTSSNITIANNVIYGVNGSNFSGFSNSSSIGIAIGVLGTTGTLTTVTGGVNLYHNSVNMYGNYSRSGADNTAALYVGSAASALDIRNNVLVNSIFNTNGTSTGTKHYAVYSAAANTAYTTINHNLYFTPGTQGVLGFIGSDRTDLSGLQSGFGGNTNSVVGDPLFASNTNLIPGTSAPVLAVGTPVSGITTDFIGDSRSATTPSIGAYENGRDAGGPTITYTTLGNTALLTNRSLSATITDVSGVDVTTAKPRIYFKKSTDANAFVGNTSADNGWKFVEATNAASPFDFVIDYALINGGSVAVGDVIQYFVVAQDLVSPPNVGQFPALTFASAPTSVALVAGNFPTTGTPSSYSILPSFAGIYNVGTGETYTSLTGAGGLFAAINAGALTGNVTVNITSDLTETGATALNQWIEEGVGGYTLTIQPSAAAMRTITSSFVGGVIRLNGADRVTIDGRFGGSGSFLTINHTATTSTRAAVQLISLGTGAGATNNTIRNVTFTQALGGTASYGISAGGSATGTAGADHDNLVIQDNVFTNANFSIYAEGTAAGLLDGLVISGNTLNSTVTLGTLAGIRVVQATSPTISANSISLETNQAVTPVGISLETGVTGAVVSRNLITKVLTTITTGWGGRGITVATGSASSNITIANNVIYGVNGSNFTGFGNSSSMGIGIGVLGTTSTLTTVTGGVNLYYNSVNMYGTYSRNESSNTAALYVGSAASALDIRNNVLVNTLFNINAGGTGSKNYAIFSVAANTAYTTINHNLYFVPGTQGVIGRIGGTDCADLAALQAGFGGNANAVVGDPRFVSNTDLTTETGSAASAAGTPVSVTTDYAGTTRSASTPSIGAYENAVAAIIWNGTSWSAAPAGRNVTFAGNYAEAASLDVQHVTINSGVNVTVADGQTLTIRGNLSNAGTLADANTGTNGVTFAGTNAQAISGAGTTTFRNLTLNNSASLTLSAPVNVTNVLTFTAGVIASGGNLTLKSTSESATATVVGGTNTSITGNVTIERFFKLDNAGTGGGDYKFFSQPLQSNIAFSAVTGLGANDFNVIMLDETAVVNNSAGTGWVSAGGPTATMTRGRGYAHWITADKTISYSGSPQLSSFTTSTLSYTAANAPFDGFNLIGNPFPSVVNLDALTRSSSVAATYYVYNHTTDSYWTWTAGAPGTGTGTGNSQFIAPGQAFIVKTSAASPAPTVTFPIAARVSNTASHFRAAQPVRLTLETSAGLHYETAVRFAEGATAQYDDEFDALFFPGSRATTPKFATVAGERRLALNSLPLLNSGSNTTVPVYMEAGTNGLHIFRFDAGSLDAGTAVYLADHATGEMIDLRVRPVYVFEATGSDRKDRFVLHFHARQISTPRVESALADAFYAYPLKGAVGVSITDAGLSGELEVLDLTGRVVSAAVRFAQGGTMTIELPQATAGVYLVRIRTDKGMAVKRVVLE